MLGLACDNGLLSAPSTDFVNKLLYKMLIHVYIYLCHNTLWKLSLGNPQPARKTNCDPPIPMTLYERFGFWSSVKATINALWNVP